MVHPALYVPNIIGYLRTIFLILSWVYSLQDPVLYVIFYSVSYILDALDGYTARLLNQCSRFGAVLDMVIDRASTSCLFVVLSNVYPKWGVIFSCLISLDISSHFMQMYSALYSKKDSHKDPQGQNFLLRLYYGNKFFLGLLVTMAEVFNIFLYLSYFDSIYGIKVPLFKSFLSPDVIVTLQQYIPQQFINMNVFGFVALLSMPLAALKHFINLVQLLSASSVLIALDQESYVFGDSAKKNNSKNKKNISKNKKKQK
ncbi:cdp-diacylglycerol--inositol 3-phosphatidyltransferase [Anaeramoeba flamelloides]|uniref:CDP-diacylglycerol--inositol 3-phosphatidyltransferase n=1 Tax=Anaeramoeba flamelloides TaxID=1746091 RepID=A0AAV7YTP4_9EUKA|nr:cdp-diacylglycerol--inositol 3-phosphatidyltransferase [Anaeramoeba flamelloides]KAJ6228394.1 cdp-diacylglycerol--inositol 3-phosphatidyltransferase [Anaeramoeba flamelloides]